MGSLVACYRVKCIVGGVECGAEDGSVTGIGQRGDHRTGINAVQGGGATCNVFSGAAVRIISDSETKPRKQVEI